jgi:hypothetical protein
MTSHPQRERGRLRAGTLALALTCALPAGGTPVTAQAPPPAETAPETTDWLGEAAFAYTAEKGRAWRDAVLPEVERQAGRRFRRVPPVRLVTRSEVHEMIVDLSIVVSRAIDPDITDAEVEVAVTFDSLMLATSALGWYDYRTDTLCLAAGNLAPLADAAGVPGEMRDGIMKLVIAHELAHALHHQHLGIDRQLAALRTSWEDKAYSAAAEGFATLVQERTAEALGLEEADAELMRLMSLDEIEHEGARPTRTIFTEIYAPGLAFCRYHRNAGGTARLWSILEAPPVTYAQILAPATYGDPVTTRMSADRLFAGTRVHFRDGHWGEMAMTAAPDQVARPFMSIGRPAAAEVQRNVRVAYSFVLSDRISAPPRLASFVCYELADAEYGARLTERLGELAETQMKRLRGAGEGLSLEEYGKDTLEDVRADSSRLQRITLSPPAGAGPGPRVSLAAAAAHRGTWTVQVVSSNAPLDDPAISQVLTLLLDRLDSGFAVVPVEPISTDDPLNLALSRLRAHLADADWTEEPSEVAIPAIAQLLGGDVQARAAVERALQRAAGRLFECHATGQSLVALLIEMRSAEAVPQVVDGLRSHLSAPLEQFKTLPGTTVTIGERSESVAGDSIAAAALSATLTISGRGDTPINVRVMHRDRHILYMVDSNTVLEGAALDQAVMDLFDAVP